ncbi:Arginine N-succinyltransferase [Rubripirellula lacrimiformis]|uniref:Arginine N-succinyltransferase n=1 Tax=Rubripirellula lacrimiformis TaxID=1930273 RepID=A0A517NKK2_9BACT|nr:arginine N-succinyltransferase [Rubripirellula lacrimiformis]QDT07672.1 Arginine N-succinyltransferase [Rubripirellula lacrimiformis]
MEVVRAVCIDDLDDLLRLVQSATRGLTSLQLNREQLLDRIEQSVFAFSRTGVARRAEPYVLVMLDRVGGEIVGTSTIYARTGGHQPLYAYQLTATDHHSESLGVDHHRESLTLFRAHDGPTEIGSLFLRGKYRGGGRGRWLSLARFMIVAMKPHRFAETVIAEMRGRAEPDGRVPFWDAVAGRFIPVDFAVADAMSTLSKDFIEDMMPQHPIYLDLLPDAIRQGIGQVHTETLPAIAMLRKEGFRATDLIDIFDAGPVIECPRDQVGAVQRCRSVSVAKIAESIDDSGQAMVVATDTNGFTSVMATVVLDGDQVQLSAADADVLGVDVGSDCWVMLPRPNAE